MRGGRGCEGRGADDDGRIDGVVGQHDAERLFVDLGGGGGDQVDGVGHRGIGVDHGTQRRLGRPRTVRVPRVRRRRRRRWRGSRPSGVADDGHAMSARQRLGAQHQRHVEQLVEGVDADDAGLAEQGVDGDVGAGHRRGVRRRRPYAGGRSTALHRDDRLAARDPPGDAGELARVAERLEVQQDHVGAGVVLPVLEQVVAADVGLVADRDEAGHAEADRADRSRMAMPRAPDWDCMAMRPGAGR